MRSYGTMGRRKKGGESRTVCSLLIQRYSSIHCTIVKRLEFSRNPPLIAPSLIQTDTIAPLLGEHYASIRTSST